MKHISPNSALSQLDREIFSCDLCVKKGLRVQHPQKLMSRGSPARIIVVGLAPGKKELASGQPFSGPAGKKLMIWLVRGGLGESETEIRTKIYFTALVKCNTKIPIAKEIVRNCAKFLERQFISLKPRLIITLGEQPLEAICGAEGKLERYVGKSFSEEELSPSMFPRFPPGCIIIPLPHPSGASPWPYKHAPLLDQALNLMKVIAQRLKEEP